MVSNVSNLSNLSNKRCWGLSPSVPAPHRLYTFYMFYMVKSFGKMGRDPNGVVVLGREMRCFAQLSRFGVTPMVGKRPPLTLRFKLRVIQPATCCAHIFCFSWRKHPPDLLYFTTLLGSVPKCSTWLNLLEKRGETPTALWFLVKKCDVLRSYLVLGQLRGWQKTSVNTPVQASRNSTGNLLRTYILL